jgi:HEAT repeat protein
MLKQSCDKLIKAVAQSSSYAEAVEAATALSYIKDPVVVPYLKKVLEADKRLNVIALDGLRRVATDDALEEIIFAAQSQNHETAEYAKGLLGRMKGSVQNPVLKEKIRNLLP